MPPDNSLATHRIKRLAASGANWTLNALLIAVAAVFLNEAAIPLACGALATFVFMKTAADVMSLPLVRTFAIFAVFMLGTGLSYWLLSFWLGTVPSLSSLARHAWTVLAPGLGL